MFAFVIINTLHSRPSGNKTTNSASKRDGKATSNYKPLRRTFKIFKDTVRSIETMNNRDILEPTS